jgi:hypothetical protein
MTFEATYCEDENNFEIYDPLSIIKIIQNFAK